MLARNAAYPSNYAPLMSVIDVTEAEFQTKVLEASKSAPVVVDFWATWCEPCKTLSPILERVANEPESGFTLAKIDVDQNQQVSQAFGSQSSPTVIAFKDGRPVDMFTGAVPENQVRDFISRLVPPVADPKVVEVESMIDAGNIEVAKQRLNEILEIEPTNQEAALTLAGLLIEESATDEALAILERQAPTAEVRQMMAAARLLASGEVGVSDPEAALPRLLATVEARGEEKEAARLTMIDLFDMLGPEHPLTLEYRRRLASALF
ncbi:tetratricopeptide repeat protein [soil metagenome]